VRKIIYSLFLFFIASLWSEENKVVIQLSFNDLNSYINGKNKNKSYLLNPWPYKESHNFLIDPQTDFYLTFPQDRENFELYDEEIIILERLSDLWKGNIGFTFILSDKLLDSLNNEKNYDSFLMFLSDYYRKGFYSVINWDYFLVEDRSDFSIILRLMDDLLLMGKGELKIIFSLDRYTKPVKGISERADYIVIKSYDNSGRHSTLENAEEAIETFIKRRGFDPSQLILGIPLYGRKFRSSDPGYWTDIMPYSEIISLYQPPLDSNESNDYYFNGFQLTADKADLIKRKKMAGASLTPINWDVKGNNSLLEVFRE
jgi:hypothetical protein